MQASPARTSTADITVPSLAPATPPAPLPPASEVAFDVALNRIRAMLDGCGTTDRNALLTIAIEALIGAGVNSRSRIIGAAQSLGFNASHAGAVLERGREWVSGTDGVYRLFGAVAA